MQQGTATVVSKEIKGNLRMYGALTLIFTARYVFDLAFENIIKVAVVSHPSLLQVPVDLEVRFRC